MTPQANVQSREQSYYEVMGLDPTCSPQELKSRYRDLAREHHPDQLGHLSFAAQAASASEMAAINEAYDTLSDPSLRRAYDQRRQAEATAREPQFSPTPTAPPKRPLLAWLLIALVLGGAIALWLDASREDRRGFSEDFSSVTPLLAPYVHKDRETPGPSVRELMQSPQGTIIKRALQPEMTPESCLRAFPSQLRAR